MLSRVQLLVTTWTAAYQAPLSMGFSRQEYWSGVPLPSPGIILLLGIHTEETRRERDTLYPNVHHSTVYNSQDMEAT